MPLTAFVKRVTIKDYKSIAACSVDLEPLTFLVGPNGSGKSNFLDALRFIADALRYSLDHALRDRGGINDVRRRSSGHPTHFAIAITIELGTDQWFQYSFKIGARPGGGYVVQGELCHSKQGAFYEVHSGKVVKSSLPNPPLSSSDQLYLAHVSGFAPFSSLYRTLSRMGFYNLNPDRIRDLQPPDAGEILARDGANLAAVLATLARKHPDRKNRLIEFMKLVVPGINSVSHKVLGPKETLEFVEASGASDKARKFLASSMSDGTLRALGVLTALYQSPNGGDPIPLIGIEEPETALHPAAAGVLLDGLREASASRQVLVTSHSSDLLDRHDIPVDSILAVTQDEGKTVIAPLDKAGLQALKNRLRTAGELLRINQLDPDWKQVPKASDLQLLLRFEER